MESGIGEGGLFRGWPINDLLVQFREAPQDKLQVVVPNIYLRNPQLGGSEPAAAGGSPSVTLFCLPCPLSASTLVRAKCWWSLDDLLLSRDPANLRGALSWALGGYSQNAETSYLGDLEGVSRQPGARNGAGLFPAEALPTPCRNCCLAGSTACPNRGGFSLRVRYSLSQLPNNPAFEPRPADERVGYFITAFRSPTRSRTNDPFVRYINRWHLEKAQPRCGPLATQRAHCVLD